MRKFILLAAVAFIVTSTYIPQSLPLRIAAGACAVALIVDIIRTLRRWNRARD